MYIGFEAVTLVNLKITVFWNVNFQGIRFFWPEDRGSRFLQNIDKSTQTTHHHSQKSVM
jgi:hypothetical protein